MRNRTMLVTGVCVLVFAPVARAEIKIITERNRGEQATAGFTFRNVPAPAKNDEGSRAKWTIVEGERDPSGGELEKLHDGRVPSDEDQPGESFFFKPGSEGGRLVVDLGNEIPVKQINTYSWHSNTRGPQVYQLYGSEGKGDGFNPRPAKGTDLEKSGWKMIAKVDTRPKDGTMGGQYGVSISDSDGMIGPCRYLLFDISRTEDSDAFGTLSSVRST